MTEPDDRSDPDDPISRLRAELAALRAELANEVRTHRVVVVDAAGHERVVLSTDPGVGSVRVNAEDGDPSVELYAVDAVEADGPEAGIAVVVEGEVVRSLHALAHRPPRP